MYKSYFIEKRRNPELNVYVGAWDYFKKLILEKDIVYISFTKIDKLGLNPHTEYNTPIGIYSYPLQALFEDRFDYCIEEENVNEFVEKVKYSYKLGDFVPFAGNAPFVTFFKVKKRCKYHK